MSKLSSKQRFCFRGAGVPITTGTASDGPFKKYLSGTGAMSKDSDGLSITAPSGAGVSCLYQDDVLAYDIDEIVRVEFLAKLTVDSADMADSTVVVGLASARNDDPDSIAQHCLFKAAGNTTLLLETDDGTNDNDDIDSGLNWNSSWQRFAIDLSVGVKTQAPPYQSSGGKSNVYFYAGNSTGRLRHVGANTGFDVSNYAGGLQLYAQVRNTASDDDITLAIREICVTTIDN